MPARQDRSSAAEPNDLLRQARLRIESPGAAGQPLSRQELAELLNAAVFARTGRTVCVDDHYIGKLERGVIRWPQADYRAALRTILRVRSDDALGFRRPRRTADRSCASAPIPVFPPGFGNVDSCRSVTDDDQELPSALTGAGDSARAPADEWSAMLRRDFLSGAVLSSATGLSALTHLESYLTDLEADPATRVAVLRAVITAQRRREGAIPAQRLLGIVAEHLRLLDQVRESTPDPAIRRQAAEALSEGFGFLAWLSWDMWEIGSAQRWYSAAVRQARLSGHPTLAAYMLGSAAIFSAQTGTPYRGLLLMEEAFQAAAAERPGHVDAWLYATKAVAQSAAGDAEAAWRCLDRAAEATARIPPDEHPQWPWVRPFDETRLAAFQLTAAVDLKVPDRALASAPLATAGSAPSHAAQYALTLLQQAQAHAMNGDHEQSAAVAITALDAVATKNSQRVLQAAWRTRHMLPETAGRGPVADFEERLRMIDSIKI